ncbi:unnamed protein product [Schistosoma rodhaini]|uniref:Uncharacterized protein n=1 Tax=Schistosoma rodhaini TaxID=6188 RepID=A0AA85GI12_9TREM|nr:unnamed protein product [Schistosoma rodhaini]
MYSDKITIQIEFHNEQYKYTTYFCLFTSTMLNRFIVILVFVFVGIVTFDNVQGQRDPPRTNNTIRHTTNNYVGKLSHHNTVPAKTTPTPKKSQHSTTTARHHSWLKTTLSHHNTVPAKTTPTPKKSQHSTTTARHHSWLKTTLSHHNTVPAKTTPTPKKSQHSTTTARHHSWLKTTLSHHNTVPAKTTPTPKKSQHSTTTARSQHTNTTPSHTDKTVQENLISLLFSLISQIKTIESSENENLLKLATMLQRIFEQQSQVENRSPTKTPAKKIFY